VPVFKVISTMSIFSTSNMLLISWYLTFYCCRNIVNIGNSYYLSLSEFLSTHCYHKCVATDFSRETRGFYRVFLWSCPSVLRAKWSYIFQIKTNMFLDGTCVALLHFGCWKLSHHNMLQLLTSNTDHNIPVLGWVCCCASRCRFSCNS